MSTLWVNSPCDRSRRDTLSLPVPLVDSHTEGYFKEVEDFFSDGSRPGNYDSDPATQDVFELMEIFGVVLFMDGFSSVFKILNFDLSRC